MISFHLLLTDITYTETIIPEIYPFGYPGLVFVGSNGILIELSLLENSWIFMKKTGIPSLLSHSEP